MGLSKKNIFCCVFSHHTIIEHFSYAIQQRWNWCNTTIYNAIFTLDSDPCRGGGGGEAQSKSLKKVEGKIILMRKLSYGSNGK